MTRKASMAKAWLALAGSAGGAVRPGPRGGIGRRRPAPGRRGGRQLRRQQRRLVTSPDRPGMRGGRGRRRVLALRREQRVQPVVEVVADRRGQLADRVDGAVEPAQAAGERTVLGSCYLVAEGSG